jgi:hypothetical protein
MKTLPFVAAILALVSTMLTACGKEPDEAYVRKQFARLHNADSLITVKNTETSPPCFYWAVTYQDSSKFTKTETWQFCEGDSTDWNLKVLLY